MSKHFFKVVTVIIAISLSAVACGDKSTSSTNTSQKLDTATAENTVYLLSEAGCPIAISDLQVYNEATDPNELLGRPNQYTSKVNFKDNRHLDALDYSNSIEVFANKKDATARREYIESITKDTPMFAEYIYQKDNVLLRLEKALTPDEAKAYQEAFESIDFLQLHGATTSSN